MVWPFQPRPFRRVGTRIWIEKGCATNTAIALETSSPSSCNFGDFADQFRFSSNCSNCEKRRLLRSFVSDPVVPLDCVDTLQRARTSVESPRFCPLVTTCRDLVKWHLVMREASREMMLKYQNLMDSTDIHPVCAVQSARKEMGRVNIPTIH